MQVYEKSDVVQGGKCQIPKDRYRVRVIGEKFGKSSSDADMTTLTVEIIEPEEVLIDNQVFKIAGRQAQMWLMHVPGETWGQSRVFEFMDKLGLDYGTHYDPKLIKEYFHGVEFDIVLSSEEDIQRYPKQQGEKMGKPILDGEGNPITNGYRILANLDAVPDKCRPTRVDLPF